MLTRERLSLLLSIIVVVGLLSFLSATLPASGSNALAAPPIIKVLKRRYGRRKEPPNAAELAELRRQVQSDQERKLNAREFKDVPLKIKEIRNLQSDTWYKDLQIEVKNIGTKPIYGILAYLEFPDHKPGGRDIGMVLSYGDWDLDVRVDPQDLHLDPDQTYVFTIPARDARVLQKKHERAPQEFKKLDFHIDIISFGDRTGFQIGHPVDLRNTKPNRAGYKNH